MLEGVRILDFSNYLPGPFASLRLAEFGAEIIKIEPLEGDPSRKLGLKKNGTGLVFLANNRQKKSITLNLKKREGREIALKLMSSADAVLESFRPGTMEKLGLGYEEAKKRKPDIVYCSITGFGPKGIMSTKGSHDINYMAVSGVLSQMKDHNGTPIHPSITFADYFGGLAASERILAGLVTKGLTGKGSYHCVSIADVMASLMGNHLMIEQETGNSDGIEILNGKVLSYAIYETKDQRFVSLGALEMKFWKQFCLAVDHEDWIHAHLSKSEENNPVYHEVIQLFKSKTIKEWIRFAEKVDCCLTPVLETNELQLFSTFKENQTVFYIQNDTCQVKMHCDFHNEFSGLPPEKGEHTLEVIRELLDVSEDQLSHWKDEGVI